MLQIFALGPFVLSPWGRSMPKTGDCFWALIDMSSALPFFKERVLFFWQVTIRIQQTFAPQEGVGGIRAQLCHLISAVKSIKSTHTPKSLLSCIFFLGFSVRGLWFQELQFIQLYFEKHLMMYELSLSLSAPLIQKCTTVCINYPFSGFPSWIVAPPSRSAAEFRLPVWNECGGKINSSTEQLIQLIVLVFSWPVAREQLVTLAHGSASAKPLR